MCVPFMTQQISSWKLISFNPWLLLLIVPVIYSLGWLPAIMLTHVTLDIIPYKNVMGHQIWWFNRPSDETFISLSTAQAWLLGFQEHKIWCHMTLSHGVMSKCCLWVWWQMTNLDGLKQQTTAAIITVIVEMDKINYQLDIMLREKWTWKLADRNFFNLTSFLWIVSSICIMAKKRTAS